MIQVEEARRLILERVLPLGPEPVPLAAARHRILRGAARADLDSPPFDASAMDGYAARRTDLGQALRVIDESAAGAGATRAIGPGECIRIFTGAPIPSGADCVIRQEDTAREGANVRITNIGPAADFIRRRGENRRAGEVVVPAGARLGAPELAALAGVGVTAPEVSRQPACFHLVTGNELVAPSVTPVGAQIRDSNSALIEHLVAPQGARLAGHARASDDLDAAQRAVGSLAGCDVLLVSGGAGRSDHDLARPLLQSLGFEIVFDQLNLRPGKPLVFARKDRLAAFALPGNPVSHWVTFHLFVAPLLEKLQTGLDPAPTRLAGWLAPGTKLPPADTRRTFWPCRAAIVGGRHMLAPLPLASSGDGGGLVGANALLDLGSLEAGALLPRDTAHAANSPTGGSSAPTSIPNSLDAARPVEFIPCP
jgi:molybdopterin molybdotransferase